MKNNVGVQGGEFICVMCLPYTGGSAADGALYVSCRFQDVEGHKADLIETITTLPPAL